MVELLRAALQEAVRVPLRFEEVDFNLSFKGAVPQQFHQDGTFQTVAAGVRHTLHRSPPV